MPRASWIGMCMTCSSAVLNVDVDGDRQQLEYGQTRLVDAGVIALNTVTGGSHVLTQDDLTHVEAWRAAAVTFHRPHADTCVGRKAA